MAVDNEEIKARLKAEKELEEEENVRLVFLWLKLIFIGLLLWGAYTLIYKGMTFVGLTEESDCIKAGYESCDAKEAADERRRAAEEAAKEATDERRRAAEEAAERRKMDVLCKANLESLSTQELMECSLNRWKINNPGKSFY